MTKFILSFLVAFGKPSPKSATSRPKTADTKTTLTETETHFSTEADRTSVISTEKSSTTKHRKLKLRKDKVVLTPKSSNPRLVRASKPEYFYHIEYSFIPGRFVYSADIVFSGDVAQVRFSMDRWR